MKVKPLYDRILIKRLEPETTRGGLVIPDTAKDKPMEGEVIAVGSGRRSEDGSLHKLAVKPGQRVLIGKYSGTEVRIDDAEHVMVREDDVLGVIEVSTEVSTRKSGRKRDKREQS